MNRKMILNVSHDSDQNVAKSIPGQYKASQHYQAATANCRAHKEKNNFPKHYVPQ